MYPWAYTYNPIGGHCYHECRYCYVPGKLVKRGLKKYLGEPFLVEKELKVKLVIPEGYVVFVCSCYDLFGYWVPAEWIRRILTHCREFPETTFLFQTKNPARFLKFINEFPPKTILGTTIESNRPYPNTRAVTPEARFMGMMAPELFKFRRMVSIEPIMDFDMVVMVKMILGLKPEFVSIGADSGKNNLVEPSTEKIGELIRNIEKFTEVRVKFNLQRLLEKAEASE